MTSVAMVLSLRADAATLASALADYTPRREAEGACARFGSDYE